MTDEESELNTRLALFVWPRGKILINSYTGEWGVMIPKADWEPGASPYRHIGKPFTESLDAQAQHLWPKLSHMRLTTEPGVFACYVQIKGRYLVWAASAAAPALAAARAIAVAIKEGSE